MEDFLSVTIVIIAITCFISYLTMSDDTFWHRLAFSPLRVIQHNEIYRCFSHGLVHAGWFHLLVNMYVLYSFGQVVEQYFNIYSIGGRFTYFILYLTSLPVSCILTLIKQKNNYHYWAVGASGAVNAIVFSYVVLNPWASLRFFVIPMPAIVFGTLYLGFSYFMMSRKENKDGIGHDAHFAGALYGVLFTFCSIPNSLSHFMYSFHI